MFTIKTTQKLLRTSGDPAQEMIESQVMGPEAPEEHLMVLEQDQLEALQMETVVMEQDQLGLRAMALEQTAVIPALVLLTDPEAQAMVLVMDQVPDPGTLVVKLEVVQQVGILEVAQLVGIPALVLMVVALMVPEAQATAVEMAQVMEQVALAAAQV